MRLSHGGWIQTEEHLPHLQVCLQDPTCHLVRNLKCCFRIRLSWDKTVQVLPTPVVIQIKPPPVPRNLDLPDNSTFMCVYTFSATAGGCGQPNLHGNPVSVVLTNTPQSPLGSFLPHFTRSPGGCTSINWLGMKNQSPSELGLQRRKVQHSDEPSQRTVKLLPKD